MVIEWLFAPQCVACMAPASDTPMCRACAVALVEHEPARGPRELGDVRVFAPWRFGGPLATAIRRLKFTGAIHVARALAPLVAPVLAAIVDAHAPAIVVPVPLHWRRRLTRGFDQAWHLARHACAAAALPPPILALRRVRATPPQSTLPRARRLANLIGAFAVGRPRAIAGRAVILVDDVVTTGATFAAAAAPLYAAGATTVVGLAFARAET